MKLLDEIEYLKTVCLSHKQVKNFIFCEAWEVLGIIKPGIKYPLVMLNPIPGLLTQTVVRRGYLMSVMDKPSKALDMDNTLLIQSDCEQILLDILNKVVFEDDEVVFINEPVTNIFKENFGDWVAGASCEVQTESDNEGSCDAPFE
jgi:hypothetical protein